MSVFAQLRNAIQEKAKFLAKKITDIKPQVLKLVGVGIGIDINAEIDTGIKLILDDSFIKVIDRIIAGIDSTINRASEEIKELLDQIFDRLLQLEVLINNVVDNFFSNISESIKDIRNNLVDPILESIRKLETKFFEDINQVLDKVFDFFDGTIQDFKNEIEAIFTSPINFLDPCRKELGLIVKPAGGFTHVDLFNLFECRQLRRLRDSSTNVKEYKEVYAILQLQAFKMTCLGRGSPAFQELYMEKWLDYGTIFKIWSQFEESMTPEEAYNEALRKLQQAREEYLARAEEVTLAQQTATNGVNLANNAKSRADEAFNKASNAQNAANKAQTSANDAQAIAKNAQQIASQVNHRTQKIGLSGNNTIIDAGNKFLAIQHDGNVVVYRDDGTALWDSNTHD